MGSSASKAARSSARQYPKRTPQTSRPPPSSRPSPQDSSHTQQFTATSPGPQVRPKAYASETKDESITRDAADPAFASRLQSLGPVSSNPFASASSPYSPSPPSSSADPSSAPPQPSPRTTFTNPAIGAQKHASKPRVKQPPAPRSSAPLGGQNVASAGFSGNPTVTALKARERLEAQWAFETEAIGRQRFEGRTLVDAGTVARAMVRLRAGKGNVGEVERELRLKRGTLNKLGAWKMLGVVGYGD